MPFFTIVLGDGVSVKLRVRDAPPEKDAISCVSDKRAAALGRKAHRDGSHTDAIVEEYVRRRIVAQHRHPVAAISGDRIEGDCVVARFDNPNAVSQIGERNLQIGRETNQVRGNLISARTVSDEHARVVVCTYHVRMCAADKVISD
jgi:hypothetical protein